MTSAELIGHLRVILKLLARGHRPAAIEHLSGLILSLQRYGTCPSDPNTSTST